MAVKSLVAIQLPADPASSTQASNKNYTDTQVATKANTSHTHAESDVTSLTSDLALKAPLASPTFTGLATFAKMVQTPVTLTDASTVAVDASLGNTFRLTMTSGIGATRALGNPTNSTDGQMIIIEVIQDGTGSRLLTYGTNYAFGTTVTSPVLTTTASKADFIGFMYNSTAGKWRCIAFAPGY